MQIGESGGIDLPPVSREPAAYDVLVNDHRPSLVRLGYLRLASVFDVAPMQ